MPHPLVIAGVSGSGTRLFPRIVTRAGYFMGTNVNESEDALELYEFADRWIGPYLAAHDHGEALADGDRMRQEFVECIRRHRSTIEDPAQPWGWKQPRSLHLVPFLRDVYPHFKLIHVVRDGRDIAFGERTHLLLSGDVVLGPEADLEAPPLRMMRLWYRANTFAADFGEAEMGSDYLRVRFEDLCASPAATIAEMLRFSGTLDERAQAGTVEEVVTPQTIGRWRREDPQLVWELTRAGESALERFGYLESAGGGGST